MNLCFLVPFFTHSFLLTSSSSSVWAIFDDIFSHQFRIKKSFHVFFLLHALVFSLLSTIFLVVDGFLFIWRFFLSFPVIHSIHPSHSYGAKIVASGRNEMEEKSWRIEDGKLICWCQRATVAIVGIEIQYDREWVLWICGENSSGHFSFHRDLREHKRWVFYLLGSLITHHWCPWMTWHTPTAVRLNWTNWRFSSSCIICSSLFVLFSF